MMFLFHLALFAHGLLGLVLARFRSTTVMGMSPYEMLSPELLDLLEKLWPTTVYQVYEAGTAEQIPNPSQSYMICGAQVAWSAYYLFSKHRG